MIEQSEIKQNMDANTRLLLIRDNFCRSMETVLRPHTHLKSPEASGLYMKELSEAINQRLSSDIPNSEAFIGQLRKIWSLCLQKQKSQFWFSISEVCKAAYTVNSDWVRRFSPDAVKLTTLDKITKEETERDARTPWTLEGALKQLADTDALIVSGGLNRNLGITLRKIPIKAAERLGKDMSEYHAPPMVQVMPKPEPPMPAPAPPVKAETKPDWDLIVAGSQKPKFEDSDKPIDCDVSIEDAFNLSSDTSDWDSI